MLSKFPTTNWTDLTTLEQRWWMTFIRRLRGIWLDYTHRSRWTDLPKSFTLFLFCRTVMYTMGSCCFWTRFRTGGRIRPNACSDGHMRFWRTHSRIIHGPLFKSMGIQARRSSFAPWYGSRKKTRQSSKLCDAIRGLFSSPKVRWYHCIGQSKPTPQRSGKFRRCWNARNSMGLTTRRRSEIFQQI